MNVTGNTILITGGASGIGRGLAESFHKLGNQVIISGRGNKNLEETTGAFPGMKAYKVDLTQAESVRKFAAQVVVDFPALNAVIHNAGVMIPENLLAGNNSETDDLTINTNLLGPMRLTAELLPTLRKQQRAAILTVSSGLAFVPLAMTPAYSATKAAIHSYSQSLRYQLKGTAIQVIELAPPYVATTLLGEAQAKDPNAMPLAEFIAETMDILTKQPDATEVLVKRVHQHRFAEREGHYDEFFKQLNDAAVSRMKQHE